jgi:hypothetical protein
MVTDSDSVENRSPDGSKGGDARKTSQCLGWLGQIAGIIIISNEQRRKPPRKVVLGLSID